jgi:hypothetical protein
VSYDTRMYVANKVRGVHGQRCPCCGAVMTRRNPGRRHSSERQITVAHDEPEFRRTDEGRYIFACEKCNADQRQLTFGMWAGTLKAYGDARAERVEALADEIDRLVEERMRRYGR